MFLNRLFMVGLLAAALLTPPAAVAKAVPGAPLLRHFSNEDTKTPPSYLAVATGVGTWGNPSIEAVRLLVEAAGPVTSVEQRSWGLIKAEYRP